MTTAERMRAAADVMQSTVRFDEVGQLIADPHKALVEKLRADADEIEAVEREMRSMVAIEGSSRDRCWQYAMQVNADGLRGEKE